MDNLSKKLASNDKILETISNKMESFFLPSRTNIALNARISDFQAASSVPTAKPSKISGQSE
jgi:hypothetical protein